MDFFIKNILLFASQFLIHVLISCVDSHSESTHSLHYWGDANILHDVDELVSSDDLGWPEGVYISRKFPFGKVVALNYAYIFLLVVFPPPLPPFLQITVWFMFSHPFVQ